MAAFRLTKDQTSPSLQDTITVSGAAQDLTGATVAFRLRAVGGSTLTVDAAATVVTPAAGLVRYDWQSGDTDTAGDYVGWWVITWSNGLSQDTPEFLVEVVDHQKSPIGLCSVHQVREYLQTPQSDRERDGLIEDLIPRASRAISTYTGREFLLASTSTERIFETHRWYDQPAALIDDLSAAPDAVLVKDADGTTIYTATVATDVELLPLNRVDTWQPYTGLRFRPASGIALADDHRLHITGTWGFPEVPEDVVHAAVITTASWLQKNVASLGFTDEARDPLAGSDGLGGLGLPAAARHRLADYRGVRLG